MTQYRLQGLDGQLRNVDPKAVQRLRDTLRGALLQPESDGYEEARRVWNGMVNRRPGLIACCATNEDVQRVVSFAYEQEILLAVRGGGHSFPGHSTCDGGMMLDLSHMKRVTIDAITKTAIAQPGMRWADLDAATQEHGLAVPGGQISHTGIAGLTVGGGMGWLARQFGLTVDHLVAAAIVTADGNFRRAAPDGDSDLFWAIRGGGGNFGVVTSFEYQLVEVGPDVTIAQFAYPLQEAPTVFQQAEALLEQSPNSLTGTFAFLYTPEGVPVAALTLVSTQPAAEAARQIARFRTIGQPLFEETVRGSYTALQRMLDHVTAPGFRYYARSNFLDELAPQIVQPLAAVYQEAPSPSSLVIFIRLGGAVAQVGPNETAFVHRSRPWSLTTVAIWTDEKDDSKNKRWVEDTWKALPPLPEAVYVNELENEGEARIRAAYGTNYERLSLLKRRYDPTNLFRLNQNIAPA